MENVSEWQRRAHEELDRLEAAIIEILLINPLAGSDTIPNRARLYKQKLVAEHQIAALLEQMTSTATSLESSYQRDTLKNDEIEALTITGSDLSPFYQQLKGVKDHHRRLPTNAPAVDSIEMTSILSRARVSAANLANMFSGEESFGRFLDLNGLFEEALTVMGSEAVSAQKFDYLTFLRQFSDPTTFIPEQKRSTASYAAFLDSLLAYLKDFMARSRPLAPPVEFMAAEALAALDAQLAQDESEISSKTVDENESDLYCRACQKLFSNAAVYAGHLTGKKHLKAIESNQTTPSTENLAEAKERLLQSKRAELQRKHSIARREVLLRTFGSLLQATVTTTLGNVERRQALTPEERAALEAEEEAAEETEATEETENDSITAGEDTMADGRIYNPLKLPLDWDGKPIPFWLWKLHSLGVPFPCEICGNFVYMGRRAFDQHFYEWRHSHGMKCLGIPNTRHFFQITSIEEAKRLWEKMRDAAKNEVFRPELQEECEDAAGNVYERRTFEDLKRQGLL